MKEKKQATLSHALFTIVVLIASLYFGIVTFGADPHIPLLIGTLVAGAVAIFALNYSWEEVETSIINGIRLAMQAIIILMIIGTLVGTWLLSGTVPTLIYYGLEILAPGIFLIATLLICSIVSISIGSSWTTAATIGIALLGVGTGFGFPPAVVAGAIISGAYFGDKMSPLSDTTNLSPAMAGGDLFGHIKYMIWTTAPAYIIALVFYGILGATYSTTALDPASIIEIQNAISGAFNISPFLVIPPILVIVIVIFKVPAIPGLLVGTILGGIFAAVFQGAGVGEIIDAAHYGFYVDTGVEIVDDLISGGGLDYMMWTVSLIIIALSFGGIMESTGMLKAIGAFILRFAKGTGSLVLATILSSIFINLVSGDQYLALVIPGRMYKDTYKERGLSPRVLSRALEGGGTVTSPFIPWNTCGAYMYRVLGVHPFAYAPYAVFNYMVPVFNVLYAYTGFKIDKLEDVDDSESLMTS
jgi:NhaC family Na+:H+ antiporter